MARPDLSHSSRLVAAFPLSPAIAYFIGGSDHAFAQ